MPTQPLRVPPHLGIDHFAAYPMEFPRRIIRGWSPPGICTTCGEGRRPVAPKTKIDVPGGSRMDKNNCRNNATPGNEGRTLGRHAVIATITGYACACTPWHVEPAPTDLDPDNQALVYDWHLWDAPPTRPAVILDTFGGTGTTALVAKALGRTGISVDLSGDYCRLATWRTTDPRELAAAMEVEKPDKVHDGQLDLFDGGAA